MSSDLDLAISAAIAGAAVAMEHFAEVSSLDHDWKSDGTIVTAADVATEKAVRDALRYARRDDAFIGEETGISGESNRRWILDGIDGTAIFVNGDDRWLSLAALEVDGEIEVGVAIMPAQGLMWFAERGAGAYRQPFARGGLVGEPERLTSSGHRKAEGIRWALLPPIEQVGSARFESISGLLAKGRSVPWNAHPALMVAKGDLDLAAIVGGKVWDYAPFAVILEEAGARFCSSTGSGHPCLSPYLFAATPDLAAAAVEVLGV